MLRAKHRHVRLLTSAATRVEQSGSPGGDGFRAIDAAECRRDSESGAEARAVQTLARKRTRRSYGRALSIQGIHGLRKRCRGCRLAPAVQGAMGLSRGRAQLFASVQGGSGRAGCPTERAGSPCHPEQFGHFARVGSGWLAFARITAARWDRRALPPIN